MWKDKMRLFYRTEWGLLAFLLIPGLIGANLWGFNWDEFDQYYLGRHTFEYLAGERRIDQITNIHYGSAFELFAYTIQRMFRTEHSEFLAKHILLQLFFISFLMLFYRFLHSFFENKVLALTGVFILFFSPRIYGDTFHNTKDIVFMICTFFCFMSLYRFAQVPSNRNLLIHTLLTILLLDTRFAGTFMMVVTGFVFLVLSIPERAIFKYALKYFLYLVCSFGILYIVWLYPRFLIQSGNYQKIKELFSFDWGGNVLYFGEFIRCSELPRSYFFVWLGISTPPLLLLLIILSFIFTATYLFYKNLAVFKDNKTLFLLVAFLIVFVMCLLAYFKKVIMYDAWRQMFFLYPFMVFLVISFLHFLKLKNQWLFKAGMVLCMVSFLQITFFYLTEFPFYNLYFNRLISHRENYLYNNFEIDYWGTSYRQAIEYIDQHDSSENIQVYYENPPFEINLFALRRRVRNKIKHTKDKSSAKYFVSNGRDNVSEIRDSILWEPYKTFRIYNSPYMQIKKKKAGPE